MGSQPSCAEDEVPEELLAPWEWRGWARSSDALGNYKSFLQPLQTAQIIRTQHIKDILVWGVSPACATTNGTFTHLQETERIGRWTIHNKATCHFITPHVLPSAWDFVLGGIQAWPFQPTHIKKKDLFSSQQNMLPTLATNSLKILRDGWYATNSGTSSSQHLHVWREHLSLVWSSWTTDTTLMQIQTGHERNFLYSNSLHLPEMHVG